MCIEQRNFSYKVTNKNQGLLSVLASPDPSFKSQLITLVISGASVIGRLSSWLSTVWTSLQAVVAVVYIGELVFRSVPFSQCASKVRLEANVR